MEHNVIENIESIQKAMLNLFNVEEDTNASKYLEENYAEDEDNNKTIRPTFLTKSLVGFEIGRNVFI